MTEQPDMIAFRRKIAALKSLLADLDAPADEGAPPDVLESAPAVAARPFAVAAVTGAPLFLTEAQRRICIRVINVFETGKVEGEYGAISIFHDGPGHIRQVTYGRAQTTEYGNLRELISDYAAASGRYSDPLKPYVEKIGTKVGTPPHSPLVDDQTFLSLLEKAGDDPVMRRTQDAFFDRVYLQPALAWAGRNGFAKALSALVIYDSFTHSGGILSFLRARFPEPTPANGGDEKTWVAQYVAVRQDWLANSDSADLRNTVYRTKDLTREIDRGNWDLAQTPIRAHGVPVDGAPDRPAPVVTRTAAFSLPGAGAAGPILAELTMADDATAIVDGDPGAPAEGEDADTADLDTARLFANIGSPLFADMSVSSAMAFAARSSVRFDVSRAEAFLDACEHAWPRVTYGLGKKAPFLNATPGHDFTQIDCSGFVREAIRLSTSPTIPFPDGSVVQHDWIRAHGFASSSVADATKDDGLVRIAFLRPQDSPHHIGHVVLVSGGKTLESHGGVGPDSRKWDAKSWQAKAVVYVLAQDGRLVSS